jgi:DNA-binding response OmpR family regulator
MRLLLVEDDQLFGSAVQKLLTRTGYAIDWVQAGNDAPVALGTHDYECVLLDLGLPDISGEQLLKSIRRRHPVVSVAVVTARGSVHDRVTMLDLGADDYMVKPVDLDELSARLRALARRRMPADSMAADVELRHGALTLIPARHLATWHGEAVQLTNKEYWVLEMFLRKKDHILTRAQLEESLYGWGQENCSNTVEVYIHFLRRKFCHGLIETVRGLGYRLGPVAGLGA